MNPVVLGLASPGLVSMATTVGTAATDQFAAALDAARGLLADEQQQEQTQATDSRPQSSLLGGSSGGGALAQIGGSGRIEDVRADADALQKDLFQRVNSLLQNSGIELDGEVQLRIAHDGRLEVAGDTPQRAVIEAALASDPTIANDFRALSGMRTLVKAVEKHVEFAEAYARDPIKAVADYAELFDEIQHETLQFLLTEDGLSFEFV